MWNFNVLRVWNKFHSDSGLKGTKKMQNLKWSTQSWQSVFIAFVKVTNQFQQNEFTTTSQVHISLKIKVMECKEWLHIWQQDVSCQLSTSDVFQSVLCLWVLQPAWRPGGFDAGSVLQALVVSCHFRVTLLAQPAAWKNVGLKIFLHLQDRAEKFFIQSTYCTYPKRTK